MPAEIRCFEPSDYPAATTLWQATPGVGLSAADDREPVERFLERNPRLSFVAIQNDQLVGTVLCGHDGRRGLLYHLAVAPGHRRGGLARRLLTAALQALRSAGIHKCHVMVYRSNAEGLAFWRALAATEREELALFSISIQSESADENETTDHASEEIMITEYVLFGLPEGMSRAEVVAGMHEVAPRWRTEPDLIRKTFVYDAAARQAGAFYLWKNRASAELAHGDAWRQRIRSTYRHEPTIRYFETPLVVDNALGEVIAEAT